MKNAMLVRCARIIRIVRVLRMVTAFQELYLMVQALAGTMRTVFWACVLIFLVFCALSVVALDV
eukprot:CAMPEP_0172688328 /NCGR_PEP_ID=MMETSP1074-20121228/22350_1 /TAXON_ID=2916 /ORGANISM="Ceratium fusus, Strain PA161109" /LENGTH=63 /DNA_ID=CAMNT_0013507953 /DNA_START=1 /DNA_END=189 /DNA_ORIENTATION=+